MDTTILTEALRGLDTDMYTWKFALYAALKNRDGVELDWHLCNMQGIPEQVQVIKEQLLKKPVADKPVARYSPFLSDKENIAALENNDEMIHGQVTDICMSIRNGQAYPPKDFISGKLPKMAGYAFFGVHNEAGESDSPVLFMRRGNPFLSGAALFTGTDEGIVENAAPIIKFNPSVDFLLVNNVCYIFSSSIENDLAFENRHFAIAEKCLEKIAEKEVVGDYESFENTVMKLKNAKKFLAFNEEILMHIAGL